MTLSVELALQRAVLGALAADPAVAAIVGDRLYDSAPQSAVAPFVEITDRLSIPDDVGCIDGWDCYLRIRCVVDGTSDDVANELGAAVRAVLHDGEAAIEAAVGIVDGTPVFSGFACALASCERTEFGRAHQDTARTAFVDMNFEVHAA